MGGAGVGGAGVAAGEPAPQAPEQGFHCHWEPTSACFPCKAFPRIPAAQGKHSGATGLVTSLFRTSNEIVRGLTPNGEESEQISSRVAGLQCDGSRSQLLRRCLCVALGEPSPRHVATYAQNMKKAKNTKFGWWWCGEQQWFGGDWDCFQTYRGIQGGFVIQGVVFKAWRRLRGREPGLTFLVSRVGLKWRLLCHFTR